MKQGRAPWFTPEDLDAEQRALYDQMVSGPRSTDAIGSGRSGMVDENGRLSGPHNLRLLDPAIGTVLDDLACALRFDISIPARSVELCILETARAERSSFEWSGHARRAISLGMSEADVEAIRTGLPTSELSDEEELVRQVARALIDEHDLSDDLFQSAEAELGQKAIFDMVALITHYQFIALALRVWRAPLRPGVKPAFPTE